MEYGLAPDVGPMVHAAQVEEAARSTLQAWIPTYLASMERQLGLAPRTLPPPRSWVVSTEVDRWPEEALPSVLLLSTGLAEEPARDGQGRYRARFALGVAVVVSASDEKATDELAKIYTAAIRTCLLQQHSLGGLALGVDWEDERYDVLPGRSRGPLAAGQVVLSVDVEDVVAARSGPRGTPPDDPYVEPPSAPEVTGATATVVPRPLSGQ